MYENRIRTVRKFAAKHLALQGSKVLLLVLTSSVEVMRSYHNRVKHQTLNPEDLKARHQVEGYAVGSRYEVLEYRSYLKWRGLRDQRRHREFQAYVGPR